MANSDLTTLEAVKEFLQRTDTDASQDSIISALISRASRQITNRFEREFAPPVDDEDRVFEFVTRQRDGMTLVNLAPYDLRELTTVTLDGTTDLDATYAQVAPKPAKYGVYTHLRIDASIIGAPSTYAHRELTINGDWGFPSVPDDVEHWTIVQVALWLRRDVTAFDSTFSIDEARLDRPKGLAASVIEGLAHYKRVHH